MNASCIHMYKHLHFFSLKSDVIFKKSMIKNVLVKSTPNKGDSHAYPEKSIVWRFLGPTLQWRHNGHDSVSKHQPRECLLSRLIRGRLKKTSKLRVTGLCAGNSPETGEFPAQRASKAENVSIWWRHNDLLTNVKSSSVKFRACINNLTYPCDNLI